mgnify:CR=1 FL=1
MDAQWDNGRSRSELWDARSAYGILDKESGELLHFALVEGTLVLASNRSMLSIRRREDMRA